MLIIILHELDKDEEFSICDERCNLHCSVFLFKPTYADINDLKFACSQAKIIELRTDNLNADLFNRDKVKKLPEFN